MEAPVAGSKHPASRIKHRLLFRREGRDDLQLWWHACRVRTFEFAADTAAATTSVRGRQRSLRSAARCAV